jgi:hypothetical protein
MSENFRSQFSFFRKLMKATIQFYRRRCLKSIDANLKSQTIQFRKYVGTYRNMNSTSIQLEADNPHLAELHKVDDALYEHFHFTIPLVQKYASPPPCNLLKFCQ